MQTFTGSGTFPGVTPHDPSQSLLNFMSVVERENEHLAPSGITTDDHCTNPNPGPQREPCSVIWELLSPLQVTGLFRVSLSRPTLAGGMQPEESLSGQTLTGRLGAAVGAMPQAPICTVFQGSLSGDFRYCRQPGSIWPVVVLTAYIPSQRLLAMFAPQRSPNHMTRVPTALQPAHLSAGAGFAIPARAAAAMHRPASRAVGTHSNIRVAS